jgi:hypothetical protein
MKFPRICLGLTLLSVVAAISTGCGGGGSSSNNQPVNNPPPPPTGKNYTTCNNQQVPNWQSPLFIQNYQAAVQNFVQNYNGNANPSIGYMRIGLGRGGEINLPQGWNQSSTGSCYGGYSGTWSYSVDGSSSTWSVYLATMINFEGSLHSSKPLLVSLTPISGEQGTATDDFVAGLASQNGMSFGNQGLEQSDISNYPNCGGDWCNMFAQYSPTIAELQTLGPSCPQDMTCSSTQSTSTGPLSPLLPFATQHGANDLELYYQDWLIAFDTDPSYASSVGFSPSDQSAYQSAIIAAANAGATMQVLFPPPSTDTSSMCGSVTCFQAVQQYLMPLAQVTGAVIAVQWSDIEATQGSFDYSIPNALAQPWITAGKKVNFVFENTTYGGNGCPSGGSGSNGNVGSNCAMPSWMWTVLQ